VPIIQSWIVASAPLAFAPVFNQDGTINSKSNPAPGGSSVTFYVTGWQADFSPLADGQAATVAQDVCLGACNASAATGGVFPFGPPRITIGAAVLYGGAAPGFVVGVTQFNVLLGTYPASGSHRLPSSLLVTKPSVTQTVWITL
jgi:uncharacterized protein (TIGR03437 family)